MPNIEIKDGVKYIDGIPVVSAEQATPQAEEPPTSEDTLTDGGTGLGLGTIGRGLAQIPEQFSQRLSALRELYDDPRAVAEKLFAVGGSGRDIINPNSPALPLRLANEILKRPALTETAGGIVGGLAGLPAMAAGPVVGSGAIGATSAIGAGIANQFNQLIETTPDTPIDKDIEDVIAGGVIDTALGGLTSAVAKPALAPARAALRDAKKKGIIGTKLGANNSTVARNLVLGEDLARAEPTITKLNPFKGVDPSDPNAFDAVLNNMQTLKERSIANKKALLQAADNQGVKIKISPNDVDSIVESLRSQNINVADDIVEFAKSKLTKDTKVQGQWQPGMSSELRDNRLVGVSQKSYSPTEAQEYIRRGVDDELSKIGFYDNQTYANLLLNPSDMADMRLQTQGLNLVRRVMDKKLQDAMESIDSNAARMLGEANENISALIDYEPAVRMANASSAGALGVPHGAGYPGKLEAGGKIGQALRAAEPNWLADTMRSVTSAKMQEQMIGPIQRTISLRQGGSWRPDIKIEQLFGAVGGSAAGGQLAVQFLPRSAEALEQNINEAAPVIHKAAFEQGMKATNGNPDVAGAMASRMTNEFVKVMQRGSPDEKRAVTAAIAKMNPQAFVAGDYPDEVDGAVYEPASKEQLSKNARQHFSNRAVDAITYAKQQQEAYKEGPSRILIRKSGQVSPEVLEQAQSMQDSAVFEEASSPDY